MIGQLFFLFVGAYLIYYGISEPDYIDLALGATVVAITGVRLRALIKPEN